MLIPFELKISRSLERGIIILLKFGQACLKDFNVSRYFLSANFISRLRVVDCAYPHGSFSRFNSGHFLAPPLFISGTTR